MALLVFPDRFQHFKIYRFSALNCFKAAFFRIGLALLSKSVVSVECFVLFASIMEYKFISQFTCVYKQDNVK